MLTELYYSVNFK